MYMDSDDITGGCVEADPNCEDHSKRYIDWQDLFAFLNLRMIRIVICEIMLESNE